MKIGGFQKFSLINYPKHIAAVIFTQGCNLKCPFCHNPELIPNANHIQIYWDNILEFLHTRTNLLDGVVISGGEPTLQPDLVMAISELKLLGFKVKLDTNGSQPDKLVELIRHNLLDYIAMDIKADPDGYAEATGCDIPFSTYERSISLILKSKIHHEFRTTVLPDFEGKNIQTIAKHIKGARHYILQNLSGFPTLDERFRKLSAHSETTITSFRKTAEDYVKHCHIR